VSSHCSVQTIRAQRQNTGVTAGRKHGRPLQKSLIKKNSDTVPYNEFPEILCGEYVENHLFDAKFFFFFFISPNVSRNLLGTPSAMNSFDYRKDAGRKFARNIRT